MGLYQLSISKGNGHLCCYRGTGDKQEPGLADQRACDPVLEGGVEWAAVHLETLRGTTFHSEIGEKQQPGIVHRAYNPHQSTKEGMGCDRLMSPKENHPVRSSQVLRPREPPTPVRPYLQRPESGCLRPSWPSWNRNLYRRSPICPGVSTYAFLIINVVFSPVE